MSHKRVGGEGQVPAAAQRETPPPRGKQISNLAEVIIERGLSNDLSGQGLSKELQEKVVRYHNRENLAKPWYTKEGLSARIQLYLLQAGCALRSVRAACSRTPVSEPVFSLTIDQAKTCLAAAQGNPDEVAFLKNYIVLRNSQAFMEAVAQDVFEPEKIIENPEQFLAFKKEGLDKAALHKWDEIHGIVRHQTNVPFRDATEFLERKMIDLGLKVGKANDEIREFQHTLTAATSRYHEALRKLRTEGNQNKELVTAAITEERHYTDAIEVNKKLREDLRNVQADKSEIQPAMAAYVKAYVVHNRARGFSSEEMREGLPQVLEKSFKGESWKGSYSLEDLAKEELEKLIGPEA